jgi:hypothetical protein
MNVAVVVRQFDVFAVPCDTFRYTRKPNGSRVSCNRKHATVCWGQERESSGLAVFVPCVCVCVCVCVCALFGMLTNCAPADRS